MIRYPPLPSGEKEIPCYAVKLRTKEAWDKKEKVLKLYNKTFCSGIRSTHRIQYLFYRSEEMRDIALKEAKELFDYAKPEKRIAWICEKYLDPKGR